MSIRKKHAGIICVLVIFVLALAGCGGGDASQAAPESSAGAPRITLSSPESAAEGQPPAQNKEHTSAALDASFQYPGDWSVEEDANLVTLISPETLNSAMLVADITYEVSLFLAGRGDLETSIDALVDKYTDSVTEGLPVEDYSYDWDESDSGEIRATATFFYTDGGQRFEGFVDVEQVGGKVFLSICLSPDDERKNQTTQIYLDLNSSFVANNTDVPLEAANLSDLGFPEAPSGFYRFYSPVTGQFFIYPDSWDIVTSPHDDYVMLYNDEGALMITKNWTDRFYEIYNNNGYDVEECFDYFLDECDSVLVDYWGEQPEYHGFQYMSVENQELIKATFNYNVSGGTGRCFAELGMRPEGDTDYIQATHCLYRPGDSYSIDLFSIIMDSIVIYYPEI